MHLKVDEEGVVTLLAQRHSSGAAVAMPQWRHPRAQNCGRPSRSTISVKILAVDLYFFSEAYLLATPDS
jgi:hypothetical protein